jgi:hypothetical protein
VLDAQLKANSFMFDPGAHDLSIEDYHASAGISRSAISELKKSPLHYWEMYINKHKKKEPSREMIIGSAVHTLFLEPNLFEHYFAIRKKFDGRSNEGKKYKKDFEKKSLGKTIIEEDWVDTIGNIVESLNGHAKATRIIKDASVEKSYYWVDNDTGLLCKARPDIYNQNLQILSDLKTTKEADPDSFRRNLISGDYHIQAAMQREGIYRITGKVVNDFVFIVAPTERPYKPYIYRIEEEVIEQGLFEFKQALGLLSMCYQSNKWDAERDEIITLTLPRWANGHNPFHTLMEIYPCQI